MLRIKINPKRTPVEYAIMLVCIAGLCVTMPGCAVNESTESLKVPYELADGTKTEVKWESKLKQTLFFYWTKTKKIYKESPLTITEVGELEAMPDPNSIESVADIAKSPLFELLRGGI